MGFFSEFVNIYVDDLRPCSATRIPPVYFVKQFTSGDELAGIPYKPTEYQPLASRQRHPIAIPDDRLALPIYYRPFGRLARYRFSPPKTFYFRHSLANKCHHHLRIEP